MKQKKSISLLVLMLLLAAIALANGKRKSTAAYMLARYPKSEAFTFFTQPLENTTQPQLIFSSVWFPDGKPRIGMQCTIDEKGQQSTFQNVYNWATQGGFESRLTQNQRDVLQKLLKNMPSNAAQPTLKNLLIINFIENKKPATRIYDRSHLPHEIVNLYQTIGVSKHLNSPIATQ